MDVFYREKTQKTLIQVNKYQALNYHRCLLEQLLITQGSFLSL